MSTREGGGGPITPSPVLPRALSSDGWDSFEGLRAVSTREVMGD
jgi:hypothetical protein